MRIPESLIAELHAVQDEDTHKYKQKRPKGLSRKELRKQKRTEKKQQHHTRRHPRATSNLSQSKQDSDAKLPPKQSEPLKNSKKHEKTIKKQRKIEPNRDDLHLLYPSVDLDNEERELRRLEKALKIKKPGKLGKFFAGDGLDDLLDGIRVGSSKNATLQPTTENSSSDLSEDNSSLKDNHHVHIRPEEYYSTRTADSNAAAPLTKYIPPHLRHRTSNEKVLAKIKGLFNRFVSFCANLIT